jgi:hypothetical protein
MATTTRRSLFFLLSALGAACGGDPGTTAGSDGVSAVVEQATSENARHAEVCRHTESMSAILDDVTRHESTMNGLMARMAADSDQMRADMDAHSCSEQGMDDMSQDVTNTNAEVALHSSRMRAADTLGAGHYECAVHAQELRAMLDVMRNDSASMSCTPK